MVGGERPDPQRVPIAAQVVEPADPADVDQMGGPGQPEVHHRDQALPAGDDLRLVAELGQQSDRSRHVSRAVISECGGLHGPPAVGSELLVELVAERPPDRGR